MNFKDSSHYLKRSSEEVGLFCLPQHSSLSLFPYKNPYKFLTFFPFLCDFLVPFESKRVGSVNKCAIKPTKSQIVTKENLPAHSCVCHCASRGFYRTAVVVFIRSNVLLTLLWVGLLQDSAHISDSPKILLAVCSSKKHKASLEAICDEAASF